jgi:N-acetylmuramoyl-L-alanine amidase
VRHRRSVKRRRRLALIALVIAVAGLLAASGLALELSRTGGVALDPAAFSPGACMSYPPTSGDRNETVFLDAGHGGIDPGGVGSTGDSHPLYESTVNLPIELSTMRLLRADGFRVVLSRTRDTSVVRLRRGDVSDGVLSLQGAHDDVAARDVCANLAKADVLVGIYMDTGGSPLNGGGVTAYDTDRSFSRANLRLAGLLQRDVLTAMNAQGWDIPDEGVVPDDSVGSYVGSPTSPGLGAEAASYDHLLLLGPAMSGFFSTPSKMPGAVIEPLYITDPFEAAIAASRHGQQVIARGIARAVEQFLRKPTR